MAGFPIINVSKPANDIPQSTPTPQSDSITDFPLLSVPGAPLTYPTRTFPSLLTSTYRVSTLPFLPTTRPTVSSPTSRPVPVIFPLITMTVVTTLPQATSPSLTETNSVQLSTADVSSAFSSKDKLPLEIIVPASVGSGIVVGAFVAFILIRRRGRRGWGLGRNRGRTTPDPFAGQVAETSASRLPTSTDHRNAIDTQKRTLSMSPSVPRNDIGVLLAPSQLPRGATPMSLDITRPSLRALNTSESTLDHKDPNFARPESDSNRDISGVDAHDEENDSTTESFQTRKTAPPSYHSSQEWIPIPPPFPRTLQSAHTPSPSPRSWISRPSRDSVVPPSFLEM